MTCKYCGSTLHKTHYARGMCSGCYNKYPLVKKLCAIFKLIREGKNESKN
jgi:hypothetical protein